MFCHLSVRWDVSLLQIEFPSINYLYLWINAWRAGDTFSSCPGGGKVSVDTRWDLDSCSIWPRDSVKGQEERQVCHLTMHPAGRGGAFGMATAILLCSQMRAEHQPGAWSQDGASLWGGGMHSGRCGRNSLERVGYTAPLSLNYTRLFEDYSDPEKGHPAPATTGIVLKFHTKSSDL